MAGGSKSMSKVREWMRRRMMPRRKAGAAGSAGDNNNSGGGISSESVSVSASPSAQSSPRRKLLAVALPSSALQRWRKTVAAVFQRAAYHLLWFVESVVVVAQLCFFFLRFGFRL